MKAKPGKLKAANRKAIREARRTDLPYKETHLVVTKSQLKRGNSQQPQPDGIEEVEYKTGTAPNIRTSNVQAARKKK